MSNLNVKCEVCGKEFHVKPSHLKGTRYCSKKCRDIAQSHKVERECAMCGTRFAISPSLVRPRNFCSNSCRCEWLKTFVASEINVPGHTAGHKAQHLTELNRMRNPLMSCEPDPEKRGKYSGKKHRKIIEEHIGRKLESWEDVHHINGVRSDNRIENLTVIPHKEHLKLHWEIALKRGDAI